MWKAMYKLALRLVQQPVVIEHIEGHVFHGVLVGVDKKGLYLDPAGYMTPVSGAPNRNITTAEHRGIDTDGVEPVVFGPLFFPFAVIASFAAGTLLGTAAARPPYGYPYGYGYGPGPGYGYPYSW